jgi:hypothetical protein
VIHTIVDKIGEGMKLVTEGTTKGEEGEVTINRPQKMNHAGRDNLCANLSEPNPQINRPAELATPMNDTYTF